MVETTAVGRGSKARVARRKRGSQVTCHQLRAVESGFRWPAEVYNSVGFGLGTEGERCPAGVQECSEGEGMVQEAGAVWTKTKGQKGRK